jgi:hypothetical protein
MYSTYDEVKTFREMWALISVFKVILYFWTPEWCNGLRNSPTLSASVDKLFCVRVCVAGGRSLEARQHRLQ